MLAVQGAKIYTGNGLSIDHGSILITDDGKINYSGQHVPAPEHTEILDLRGKVVIPGLIDAHTHIGIWGDGDGDAGLDSNEWVKPITAAVNAIDAVNPLQISFEGAREGGITTVQILPGSANPVNGLGFACKTYGHIIDDMVVKNPTGLKGALGENPKGTHGKLQNKYPASRMGIAAIIREYFYRVKDYQNRKESHDTDPELEAGLKVINREIPFRVHAHRHDDIMTAIRICEEFDIDFSIEHCTDGHLLTDILKKKNIVAMVGPGLSPPSKVETADFTDENAVILHRNGVKVCLISDHPFLNCRYFLNYAAIVHKHGLSVEETLRAITLSPAEALGIQDIAGSLEKGKDADFVVLGGDLFTLKGRVEATYIKGRCVWKRGEL